jgi:sugar/nucleoside kinase (ribokinase family)
MASGIVLAGNMIVDLIKMIDVYPTRHSLTTIRSVELAMGGAVCNCGVDLARLDPQLPVEVLGIVGEDEYGDFILRELEKYPSINLDRVSRRGITSYTEVMTERSGGGRTFFTFRGADSLLADCDFNFGDMGGKLLHIGYIMLLDGMDQPDPDFGTVMARVLCRAREAGLATSIDVVSEESDRFVRLVPPSLRYADYCTINEIEAALVTGIELRDKNGTLHQERFEAACRALKAMGVSRWATVHAPEFSAGVDETGLFVMHQSPRLPEGYIKGTVGAGDAFISGILYKASQGGTLREGIELGTAIAVCSLAEAGATEGVRDLKATWEHFQRITE